MAQPKFPVRVLLKPIVDWFGRLGRKNAPSASLPCTSSGRVPGHTTPRSDADLWDLLFTPYIWAGLRFRDVSRLWTGASATTNEQGFQNSPAQVQALDDTGQELQSEQLTACRWLLDQRLTQGSMSQLLHEITYSKLILKKSVHEILWVKETDGEYAGKIVIDGFKSVDPTMFEFNPKGYDQGLYLRRLNEWGTLLQEYEPVDERRFLVVTNQCLFSDKNGISELEPLREAVPRMGDAETSWGRGAQRHGNGHVIGYYGPDLLGASAQADRDLYQEMLENIGSDTVSMAYEGNTVQELNVAVDADVFLKFIDELKTQISVVLTGSPTTLKEGKFGNRSMAESTQVRQESELEQQDCAEISEAFTMQVLRRFCDFNWLDTDVYPKMQLISEEQNAPTTPDSQGSLMDVPENTSQRLQGPQPTQGAVAKESLVKLQAAEEEPTGSTPPVAIPAGYNNFPNDNPLSPQVKQALDYAREVLSDMPVKEYPDVQPNEAPFVFTVKRFRNYTSEMLPILQEMKEAIDLTLDAPTEKAAWEEYYDLLVPILAERGIQMTPDIRNDLNISFRQARQNVFGEAIYQQALDDPGIVGLKIVNQPADDHHYTHTLWNNIAIPKEHPELQRGGRLRIPMDFGCICEYEPVYWQGDLTPEHKWPNLYPGDSYRLYAQPTERQPEAN